MTRQIIKLTAPSFWAPYLINGDDSGMEPGELEAASAWICRENCGLPVSCEDAGFRWHHDASLEMPLGTECQEYTFLVEA